MASAPSRLQRLPSPSIRGLTTDPQADSTTPVPTGKPAARYASSCSQRRWVWKNVMTLASVSWTNLRRGCLVRIGRRPPMTSPTRPRRIAVSFCCTQGFPAVEASPHRALAALQRSPTTGMMSSTNVTRFHALNPLVARGHRPRAPSSRTTKGLRCWGSRRSASALSRAITACLVRPRRARRRTCRALRASSVAPPCRGRRARRFRLDQEVRPRFRRPRLGITRGAAPHQRFLLLLPLLARAPLGRELDRLRLHHGDTLAVNPHDQQLPLGCLLGQGP